MSKTGRYNPRRAAKGRNQPSAAEHRITIRSEQRTPPDLHKLSRAVIAIALAETESETPATPRPTQAEQAGNTDQEVSHDE
ncbi:hypothetical protein [Nocardia brasiliensis]|uniref:hypothetical protein n=1 Tax=Nocardia brasiliensis TaxID=37326 RepID=UPI00245454FD|nr:hypothetical protein [Nocardia brasiliensis]